MLETTHLNELFLRWQNGDEAAFAELMHAMREPLYHHVRSMLQNEEDAHEVVQESFIKLVIKSSTLTVDGVEDSIKAWLYKVAREKAIDVLRKYKPLLLEEPAQTATANPTTASCPATDLKNAESLAIITSVLDEYPPELHRILECIFIQGMEYQEVAQLLGISVGAVKSRVHRVRETLQEKIKRRLDR